MRAYETIVVIDSQLEDEPIDKEIDTLEGLIKSHAGEIVDTERWGRRKLSFQMNNRQQGYYALMKYNADQSVREDFDRSCKLNENVLRYMTVRVKKHPAKAIAQPSEKQTGDTDGSQA